MFFLVSLVVGLKSKDKTFFSREFEVLICEILRERERERERVENQFLVICPMSWFWCAFYKRGF